MMPFKKPHQTANLNLVKKIGNGFEIPPKGLNIVWGNDTRYWKVHDQGNAELIQVSWLEVSGQVPVEKNKRYEVKFDVKVREDGFGWNGTRVLVMAKPGKKGKYQFREATLTPNGQEVTIPLENPLKISVESNVSDTNLYFGLYEVWSGKWKGGLEIIRAKVEPC